MYQLNGMNTHIECRNVYKPVTRTRLCDQRIAQFLTHPYKHLFSPRQDALATSRAFYIQSMPGVVSERTVNLAVLPEHTQFNAAHASNAICSLQRSLYSTPIDIHRGFKNVNNIQDSLYSHFSVPISISRIFDNDTFEWPSRFLHSNHTMHTQSATMLFRESQSLLTIYPTRRSYGDDAIARELQRTHIPMEYDIRNTMQHAMIEYNQYSDIFKLATQVMEVYIHRQNATRMKCANGMTPQLLLLVTDDNMIACSLFCQWMTWLFFIYFGDAKWQISKYRTQLQLAQTTFAFEKAVLILNCQHRLLFPSTITGKTAALADVGGNNPINCTIY